MKPGQSFLGGKDWFKQSKEGSDAMMESYGFYLTNGMWKRRKDQQINTESSKEETSV